MNKSVNNQEKQRLLQSNWIPFITLTWVMGGLIDIAPAMAQLNQSRPIFDNVRIGNKFTPDPIILRGVSGGSVSARNMARRAESPTGPCVGFVDRQPDHRLTLTSFFDFLKVEVESQFDTTIVIKGPGGSWCNDDLEGNNPSISGQWQAGVYGLWIGSYQQNSYHPYVIRVTQVE